MKRIFSLLLALLLLLSAAACSSREITNTRDPQETETPEPTPTPPVETPEPTPAPPVETDPPEPVATEEPEPAYRNPLNGEGMDEPYMGRPVSMMINNLDKAMPHCGTGDADIIFECLAEGGVTRMQAFYSDISTVGKIGPVRSIRPYFIDIALAYDSVIGHAGGSDAAYSRIRNEGLQNLDGVRGSYSFNVFYRDSARLWLGYEHSLFTKGENIVKVSEEKKYPLTLDEPFDSGLHFVKDATPADGDDALAAEITFSSAKKTKLFYNEAERAYSLQQHGADYIDENTGDLVMFNNVIVFYTTARVLDSDGRLAIDLTSGGRGYFACGGKFVPITWARDAGDVFRFYAEDGSDLELSIGKTYIAILPEDGTAKVLFG